MLALAACDNSTKSTGTSGDEGKGSNIPSVEDHDFAMTQEWVLTMLKENDENIGEMRSRLDALRSELERLEATGDPDSNENDFKRMRSRIDEEEKKLRKLRENAESMHEVTKGE